nr:PAS domain-containing protein [Roseomonas acroporae]
MVGVRVASPLSLYRDSGAEAFDGSDLRRLETLLPHLQRALELQRRLGLQAEAASVSRTAVDALPVGLLLVDAGLGVRFANAAAAAHLGRPGAPASLAHAGPRLDGGTYLSPRHRDDAVRLRQLVASATSGGVGGSLRLRADEPDGDRPPVAVMTVSPAPATLAAEAGAGTEPFALIVVHDVARGVAPPVGMLCDVFGLSQAEAEVAVALAGGVSAEEVARQRAVALGTVRSQVRAILDKSGAANLRDLERSLATLGALVPQGPG